MKISKRELLFWAASLNEVMRGFKVEPSKELLFGDLFVELEEVDKLLFKLRLDSKSIDVDEVLEINDIPKSHLEVIRIAMAETIKEIADWELPLRTDVTTEEASNYLKDIERYLKIETKS